MKPAFEVALCNTLPLGGGLLARNTTRSYDQVPERLYICVGGICSQEGPTCLINSVIRSN